VRTEYPNNVTDVELVVSGTPVPPDVGDGGNGNGDNRYAIPSEKKYNPGLWMG